MSMRALCLAGVLTVGLGAAASAQSIGVATPFGGVGVYGPDRYADGYDRYRYGHRGYGYRDRVRVGVYAYAPGAGVYGDAYGYDAFAYEAPIAPRSNLHRANPNANANVSSGWTIPEQDQYRGAMGFNSY